MNCWGIRLFDQWTYIFNNLMDFVKKNLTWFSYIVFDMISRYLSYNLISFVDILNLFLSFSNCFFLYILSCLFIVLTPSHLFVNHIVFIILRIRSVEKSIYDVIMLTCVSMRGSVGIHIPPRLALTFPWAHIDL